MSPEQRKRFYFPVWTETARALDWTMLKGCLLADLQQQVAAAGKWPEHARDLVVTIVGEAQRLAAAQFRAVTAEDLRHATNQAATGKPSSSSFRSGDLNQFVRLCAVLRDPWDMTATIAWLNPAEDDRLRLISYLNKIADGAVLRSISRNAWQTTDWERQPKARLEWLASQVRDRRRYSATDKQRNFSHR